MLRRLSSSMSIFTIIAMSMAIHSCYIGSKVLVSLYALDLGASQFTVGLLAAFYALVPLLLGVYTGRLADERGMRLPLMLGSVVTAIAMAVGFAWRELPGLFLVATLVGGGFVFFNVSIQTLAGGMGRPEHRTRNFAWLSIGYSGSSLIGPVFAGFSIDHYGHAFTFLMFSFLPLLPIGILLFRPQITRTRKAAAVTMPGNTLDLLKDRRLRKLILISGLSVASAELFSFYVPVFAHQIGLSASTIGIILGSYACAIIVTRFMLGKMMKHLTVEQIMVWFLLLAAAAFAMFPFFRSAYALMAAAFAIGIGVGVTQPLLMSISYERSPQGRAGEVTGLRLTVNNMARITMPVICGAIGASLGASPVFWMNAANLVATSFLSRR
ncbi:MAG TPA: MFS transporter [Burkholderiales bacterium]|nr:MFS transporter [Burkholderiales bacterium]